jgi:DNA-binding winged helix-turn-helix (wHTH) protein/tetratricopeptide (TPR) repeat protein
MPDNDLLRLKFAAFELDEREARLARDGTPLAVPPKAFAVLCALARRPGQLVRKDELLDAVWGHQYVSDSVLKSTVSELRAVLGDDPRQPRLIETASRRGYRFIGASVALEEAPSRSADAAPAARLDRPLVGREVSQNRLRAAWAAARSGRRQVVWVVGEAGIGKTTLIDHFAAGLGGEAIARGQCVEQHGVGEPYLPVLEALASLTQDNEALLALLRTVAPTWLLQLPWLVSGEDELAGLRLQLQGSGQERMLRELGELLDRATKDKPLLLVTEDLHWSDQATLRLIDHIARRRTPARLMWLATFRLAEVIAQDHPLKALRHELKLHRLADELLLDPFSEQEVAGYLASHLPRRDETDALARALHAHTDGLPLFVANVVDDLAARGALDDLAASEIVRVPESLAGVIEAQIDRLAPDDRRLLEAASVCGVEFNLDTLADVTDCDAATVGERCDVLLHGQQWLAGAAVDHSIDGHLGGRWSFRHALYRQVFYRRIGALTRTQLHRRVAASMQRQAAIGTSVAAAQLALHHELGHEPAAALRQYAAAAESALQRFAPSEAMSLTAHALALLPACTAGPQRDQLALTLLGPRVAASQLLSVSGPDAHATYERVRALREHWPDGTSGLDIELGWIHFTGGDYERALELATSARAGSDVSANRVRHVAACNLLGTTLSYLGRLDEARQRLEEGIASHARLAGQPHKAHAVVDLEVSLRCRLGQALSHLGRIDEARLQIDAANARAEQLGPFTRRLGFIFAGLLGIRLEQPQRVREMADALQGLADEHAVEQAEGPARWLRGWVLARTGDPIAGHQLIMSGDNHDAARGLHRGRSGVLGYAVEALVIAERWQEAQQQLGEALALADRTCERIYRPDLLLLQARIELGLGLQAQAFDSMTAAWREAASQQATWLALSALVALAEARRLTPEELDALATTRAAVHGPMDAAVLVRADAVLAAQPLSDRQIDTTIQTLLTNANR